MEIINGLMNKNQQTQSAEEVIATLCDRMAHSRLASDKRAAILTLKGFSREYRELVVANGLRSLIQTLREFTDDIDLLKATLETLLILFIRGEGDDDMTRSFISQQSRYKNGKYPSPLLMKQEANTIDQFSLWIADEITQDDSTIASMIPLLENSDFYIRLYTLQLFEALVSTRASKTKDLLLNSPLGIPSLVQVLQDPHDPVRNEAVLLLMSLSNDDFNIQKIIAFENTFDRLFEIIHEEGDIRGSIVVQDCLTLFSNLLKYNTSTQKLFMETNCLPKLAYLISEPLTDNEIVWNHQRELNISMVLDIVKLFVLEGNEATKFNQNALDKADIFLFVLRLSFSAETPNLIRSSALLTVADLIAENDEMQMKFGSIDVPYIDPSLPLQLQNFAGSISVITALLNWCLEVNSVHVFDIRVAAAQLLKAYLDGNSEAKKDFIEEQISWFKSQDQLEETNDEEDDDDHDKDTSGDGNPKEAGSGSNTPESEHKEGSSEANGSLNTVKAKKRAPTSNILKALLEYDPEIKLNPYKIWFSSYLLIYLIHDNEELKHIVQSISIGDESEGEEVITAIQSISEFLISSLTTQDKRISIGYLQLLIVWLYEDSEAVNDFLSYPSTVKSLLTYLSQSSSENGLTNGLVTILLGVSFEFSTKTSPLSRVDLHSLIVKMLGKDNYGFKVLQFKESVLFSEFKLEDIFDPKRDETGLPEVFFHPSVVLLIKDNYYRIKNTLNQDPTLESNGKISYEKFEQLNETFNALKLEYNDYQAKEADAQGKSKELLEKINANLANVTAKYDGSAKDLENLRIEHAELEEKFKSTFSELDKLKKSHEELTKSSSIQSNELKESGNLINARLTELENLKKKLTDVTELKKKAEDGINKMSRELFQLTKTKDALESQIKKLENENQNNKKQIEKLEKSLSQKTEDLSNLNKKLIELNNQLKTAKGAKVALEKELGEYKASDAKQSDLVAQLTEKLRTLANRHNELSAEKESVEGTLQKANIDFNDQVESLKTKVTALEKSESELRATISKLQTDKDSAVESSKIAKVAAESKILELTKQINDSSTEIKSLNEELELLRNSSTERLTDLEILEERLREANERVSQAEETHQLEVKAKLDQHSDLLESLKGNHQVEVAKHTERTITLESEVSNLNLQKKELETKLAIDQSKIEELSKQLSDKDVSLKNANSRLESLTLELDSLKKEKTESASELIDISEKLQSKNEEVMVLESQVETTKIELEKEIGSVKEAADSKIKSLKNELESSKLLLKTTKNELEKELDENALEFETKETDFKRQVNTLKESINSLEEEKKSLSASLEIISQRIEEKDQEYEKLFQSAKSQKNEVEVLKNQIKELDDGEIKTRDILDEKEKLLSVLNDQKDETARELAKKIAELKKGDSTLKSLEDKLSSQKEKHSKEINSLKSEIERLNESLEQKHQEFEKERSLLSVNSDSATKEYSEKVTKLEEELKKLEKKSQIQVEVANKQKEKLTEKVEKLEFESKSLDEDLKARSENVTSLETELSDIKTLVKSLNEEVANEKKNSKEFSKVSKELLEANNKFETLKEETDQKDVHLNDFEQKLKDKSKEILKLKVDHQKVLDSLNIEKSALEKTSSDLSTKAKELSSTKESLEKLNSNIQKKLEDLSSKSSDAQSALEKTVTEKNDEIEIVKSKVSQITDEKAKLELLVKDLKNTNDELTSNLESSKSDVTDKTAALESKSVMIEEVNVANNLLQTELDQLKKELAAFAEFKKEKDSLQEELQKLKQSTVPKSELDELMLVLDDMETKKTEYKDKAKELGAEVSSDEEDDEDDDDDEEDEEE